jgi:hypothetical protein
LNLASHTADPFYASRMKRVAPRTEERDRPVYARLPLAPRNASPVPHLTSLYHFHRAGEYGDRSYPGNCGGGAPFYVVLFRERGRSGSRNVGIVFDSVLCSKSPARGRRAGRC